MSGVKFITSFYLLLIFCLFLYSFTQIDLSLTFSRIEWLRELVKSFQYIGYFNRPLSASIYLLLILFLFNCYLALLVMAYTKQVTKRFVWKLILITTVILTLSYNAFSHDLFNYIFDAKIITHYHQNPYLHKALDFPGDPMLSFMHWTHRVYPYGPIWLVFTVPLSFLGIGLFLPTFFLFKAMIAASFLGSLYFIGKILQKISPERETFGLLFFGLSPFVLIEGLVSAHLDMVMIFFALWSFYLLLQKRLVWAFVILGISIGIKFATGFLLPIFLYAAFAKRKNNSALIIAAIVLMIAATVAATIRTTFQPWYLLEPLAFAALLSYRYLVFIPSIIVTFFAACTYLPYLYLGNWDKPVPQYLATMYVLSYVSAVVITGIIFYKKRMKQRS